MNEAHEAILCKIIFMEWVFMGFVVAKTNNPLLRRVVCRYSANTGTEKNQYWSGLRLAMSEWFIASPKGRKEGDKPLTLPIGVFGEEV